MQTTTWDLWNHFRIFIASIASFIVIGSLQFGSYFHLPNLVEIRQVLLILRMKRLHLLFDFLFSLIWQENKPTKSSIKKLNELCITTIVLEMIFSYTDEVTIFGVLIFPKMKWKKHKKMKWKKHCKALK